jgi:MFS family permease
MYFLVLGALILIVAQLLLMVTPDSDRPIAVVFYFVLVGAGYSVNTSVQIPELSYIIDSKVIGTAFGVAISLLNLGLVVLPVCVGYIQENTERDHGYYWVCCFLAGLAAIGLLSAVVVYFYDVKHGGILNSGNPDEASRVYNGITQKTNCQSF